MIDDRIPTFEAIKTLANKIKQYINNLHIFQSPIQIENNEENTKMIVYSNAVYAEDENNNTSIGINFNTDTNTIDINDTRLTGLGAPIEDTDAVPKNYLDAIKITPIKIACTFNAFQSIPVRKITNFSNFYNLITRYEQGQRIQISVTSTIHELEFNVTTYIEDFDYNKRCFYAPIYYYVEDENKIFEGIVKIYSSNNQSNLLADLIATFNVQQI